MKPEELVPGPDGKYTASQLVTAALSYAGALDQNLIGRWCKKFAELTGEPHAVVLSLPVKSLLVDEFIQWVNTANKDELDKLHDLIHKGDLDYPMSLFGKATHEEMQFMRYALYQNRFHRNLVASADIFYEELKKTMSTDEFAELHKFVDKIDKALEAKYKKSRDG